MTVVFDGLNPRSLSVSSARRSALEGFFEDVDVGEQSSMESMCYKAILTKSSVAEFLSSWGPYTQCRFKDDERAADRSLVVGDWASVTVTVGTIVVDRHEIFCILEQAGHNQNYNVAWCLSPNARLRDRSP